MIWRNSATAPPTWVEVTTIPLSGAANCSTAEVSTREAAVSTRSPWLNVWPAARTRPSPRRRATRIWMPSTTPSVRTMHISRIVSASAIAPVSTTPTRARNIVSVT